MHVEYLGDRGETGLVEKKIYPEMNVGVSCDS
jgi:hypothetical protein